MTDCVRDAGWTIPVLYEDNHLLCVEKPANLPVQADSSLDRDLLSILRDYIGRRYEKPGRVYLGLVHRLDRPVGGAMVFARTSKAAARLSAQFAAHTVQKRYYAVLQGELRAETRLENLLVSDERTGMTREARPGETGAKKAALVSTLNPGSHRKTKAARGIYLMEKSRKQAILVECGFLSNPEEERHLASPDYQKALAAVIGAAVCANPG